MKTFTLYHLKHNTPPCLVPIKVGCTIDLNRRLKRHHYFLGDVIADVLETITGTNEQASEREIFWQNYYGYPHDSIAYHVTIKNQLTGPRGPMSEANKVKLRRPQTEEQKAAHRGKRGPWSEKARIAIMKGRMKGKENVR